MKSILYISTKRSMDRKRQDVMDVFKNIISVQPTWYPSQNMLNYLGKFTVIIYHFDEKQHLGSKYDFIMESVPGLCPPTLYFQCCKLDLIDKHFHGLQSGNTQNVIDNILGLNKSKIGFYGELPDAFGRKTDDKLECIHSWKKYTGLREAFEYCERCDKKR